MLLDCYDFIMIHNRRCKVTKKNSIFFPLSRFFLQKYETNIKNSDYKNFLHNKFVVPKYYAYLCRTVILYTSINHD